MNYTIPQSDKRFSQANGSDFKGNIWISKNINFDEEGYIKLSSRAVNVLDETDLYNGGANHLGYPFSIGRKDFAGGVYITTADYTITGTLSDSGFSFSNDGVSADIPGGAQGTRGKWWQNKWHVTTDTSMKSKSGTTGTWASTGISLTTGLPHPLEVFKNAKTLCVGNGNTVQQYDTSYATGTLAQLVVPTDYTVVGLAYNNARMGVATQIAASLQGQNQEALFFVWDGSGPSAGQGYGVGSDAIMGVASYDSNWVILTRSGKVKYYNGGGFKTLFSLPFTFKKYQVGIDSMIGDIITVDDDLIYLNIPADLIYYGKKRERFLQNFVGGILCWDPKVGAYNRYTASISKLYSIATDAVATSTSIVSVQSGTIPDTGNQILYASDPSNQIGGIEVGRVYYVIKIDSTHFKLALTKEKAFAGDFIALTSNHSGNFFGLQLLDYGAAKSTYGLAVIQMGTQASSYDHLMFANYMSNTALTPKRYVNITIPGFKNKGYVVTPKLASSSMKENMTKIYIKYKPLDVDDKIIVKVKEKDWLGLPVTTTQRGKSCVWTSDTVFTTTANLSEAMAYLAASSDNELECEVIEGAGAGNMVKVTSIQLAGSTYTVTLEESVDGAAATLSCQVSLDGFKVYGTITSDDTDGFKEIQVARASPWKKCKVELQGVETTVEEFQFISNELLGNE